MIRSKGGETEAGVDLEGVGKSAEDIPLALLIADDLAALQVPADVLLQRHRQVAVCHKLGHSLHLHAMTQTC